MRRLALIAAGLLAAASPLAAQTIAITNGTLVLGDGSAPIDEGTVVIRNGRVVAAGAEVQAPADAQMIDAQGKYVTPGIVAGFSRLGLSEVDLGADGSDDTDSGNGPFNAAVFSWGDSVLALSPDGGGSGNGNPVSSFHHLPRSITFVNPARS